MQRILFLHTLRELRAHAVRYASLLALVALATYQVCGLMAAAVTVIDTVESHAQANALEDGQFSTTRVLTDDELDALADAGVTVESEPSLDFLAPGDDGDTSATIRIYANRRDVNRVDVAEGRAARSVDEVLVERRYAQTQNIHVGDTLELGGRTLSVVGIGSSADYELCVRTTADTYADASIFGTAFVTSETYDALRESGRADTAETLTYAYRLGDSDATGTDTVETDADLRAWLRRHVPGVLDNFMAAADNPRIMAAVDDVTINVRVCLFAGVVVFALVAYVISIFVAHTVEREARSIGTLRALGVRASQLAVSYLLLAALVCLAGGVLGTVLGYSGPGLGVLTDSETNYFSVPNLEVTVSAGVIAYGVVMPPLVALIVNALVLRRRLAQPPLALMSGDSSASNDAHPRPRGGAHLQHLGFIRGFQLRQLARDRRGVLAVLGGLLVSLVVLAIALDCAAWVSNLQDSVASTITYDRLYLLKDPSISIPAGGEPAFLRNCSITDEGSQMAVSMVGVEDGNPYVPGVDDLHANEVNVNSTLAEKLNLAPGSEFFLTSTATDQSYRLTVHSVVEYASGLTCFMGADDMRELFGMPAGYVNAVYAARSLDIDADAVFSTTTRDDLLSATDSLTGQMAPMINTLIGTSVAIVLVVLYQMTKVMVDRSSQGIALLRLFGFRPRELRRLYLNGNLVLVALAAPVLIVVAKLFIDAVFPSFLSAMAAPTEVAWPAWFYVAVYAGVMAAYLLVRSLLVRHVNAISPGEVLRAQE